MAACCSFRKRTKNSFCRSRRLLEMGIFELSSGWAWGPLSIVSFDVEIKKSLPTEQRFKFLRGEGVERKRPLLVTRVAGNQTAAGGYRNRIDELEMPSFSPRQS